MGNCRAWFERDAHGGRRVICWAGRSAAGRRHSLARGRLPRAAVARGAGDPHRFAELQAWARSLGIRCALRGGRSSNLVGDVQAARRLLLDDGAAFALGAPLLQLAAAEVSLTGDGRGLRKTGQGRDDPYGRCSWPPGLLSRKPRRWPGLCMCSLPRGEGRK